MHRPGAAHDQPSALHEQIRYIVDDAADDVLFVDRSPLPAVWPLAESFKSPRHVVVMDDGADVPLPDDPRILDYEALLVEVTPFVGEFSIADENTAAALCYTSGTTGNPKGVLYSHRSMVLHTLLLLMVDTFGISERDVVMPVVPMFHVNAWGSRTPRCCAARISSCPDRRCGPRS